MTVTFCKETPSGYWYYSIHDHQATLFDEFIVTSVWGRNLDRGREHHHTCSDRKEMRRYIASLMEKRSREGYRLIYTFTRNRQEQDSIPLPSSLNSVG